MKYSGNVFQLAAYERADRHIIHKQSCVSIENHNPIMLLIIQISETVSVFRKRAEKSSYTFRVVAKPINKVPDFSCLWSPPTQNCHAGWGTNSNLAVRVIESKRSFGEFGLYYRGQKLIYKILFWSLLLYCMLHQKVATWTS